MPFVGASPLANGTTTVTPVYASATAGNLLVACVTGAQSAGAAFTLSGATTGWTQRESAVSFPGGSNVTTEVWDKIATGSDTMPTWNGATTNFNCIVVEFNVTTLFDQGGTAIGTTSPHTVTAGGTDGGSGRVIVVVTGERGAAGVVGAFTDNVNGLGVGVGINVLGDNSSLSQAAHHRSVYVVTALTGAAADNDAVTWSTQASTRCAQAIVSYSAPNIVGMSGVLREDYNRAGTSWGVVPKDVWRETQQGLLSQTEDSWRHRVRDEDLGPP